MAFHSHSARPTLTRALLISIGIHAVVLLQGGFLRLSPRAVPSLVVGFRAEAGLSEEPGAAAAGASRVSAQTGTAILTTRADAAIPLPLSKRRPVATRPDQDLAAHPVAALPQPESTEGLDGDALRAFRVALATELRPFRRYPPAALQQRWGGIAVLRVAIDANGSVLPPQLVKSSGHEVLDNQALEMLRLAAPQVTLPAGLRGHGFALSLPIEFAPDGDR